MIQKFFVTLQRRFGPKSCAGLWGPQDVFHPHAKKARFKALGPWAGLTIRRMLYNVRSTMNDNQDELRSAVEGRHYVRAVNLALSAGKPEEVVRDLQKDGLWQMAAVFRNSAGTKILAEQYGMSKKEVEDFLRKRSEEETNKGNIKTLEPTFDHDTNQYLTFDEWLDHFLKKWSKLVTS
jgi:hypothetical protein